MAGKFDNVPQATREAIAIALMVASVTATAAALLHEPLFIPAGFVLFLVFYLWKINPRVKQAYQQQEEAQYADDATYQPLLDRFADDRNEDALIEGYQAWKQGPHDNQVRLRFLQEAILSLIDAGKIYRVEELMTETERVAAAEGLQDRFGTFRAECDRRIAEVAQRRLAPTGDSEQQDQQEQQEQRADD